MKTRSMPVCFSEKQYKMIEEFAKKNGKDRSTQQQGETMVYI